VFAGDAFACSCAVFDPRDELERSDGAFVGTLVERVVDGEEAIHTFTVDQAIKGKLGTTVVVRTHRDGATCGLEIEVGQEVGLFLTRDGVTWRSILCQQISAAELLEAARPLPAPSGSGPIAQRSLQLPRQQRLPAVEGRARRSPGGKEPGALGASRPRERLREDAVAQPRARCLRPDGRRRRPDPGRLRRHAAGG
jgi:hypothetical protein